MFLNDPVTHGYALSFTGRLGKMKRKYKPFDMLKLDLKKELKSRGLSTDGNKSDLTKILQKEMKGLIRVPALCFTHSTKQLEDLNLEHYEIASVEPMHDISGNYHSSKILKHDNNDTLGCQIHRRVGTNLKINKREWTFICRPIIIQ